MGMCAVRTDRLMASAHWGRGPCFPASSFFTVLACPAAIVSLCVEYPLSNLNLLVIHFVVRSLSPYLSV